MKYNEIEKDCELKMNVNGNIECEMRRRIISGLNGCLCRKDNCFKASDRHKAKGVIMKINKEIAEKVMKWHEGIYLGYFNGWFDSEDTWQVDDFTPSTDIKQAFEIVAKMRKRGFCFKLECRTSGEFIAVFYQNHIRFVGESDTPAMAICLAALKVVE